MGSCAGQAVDRKLHSLLADEKRKCRINRSLSRPGTDWNPLTQSHSHSPLLLIGLSVVEATTSGPMWLLEH